MPSATEVDKNGIYLGEMNAKLLQKIEELTLYTIAHEKQLKLQGERYLTQNLQLKTQTDKNKKLESRLERLEALLLSKQ